MKLIYGHGRGQVPPKAPPPRSAFRVIANRPASTEPFREPEKPQDAVNFMDVAAIIGAGLIVLGLLLFVWWFAPMALS